MPRACCPGCWRMCQHIARECCQPAEQSHLVGPLIITDKHAWQRQRSAIRSAGMQLPCTFRHVLQHAFGSLVCCTGVIAAAALKCMGGHLQVCFTNIQLTTVQQQMNTNMQVHHPACQVCPSEVLPISRMAMKMQTTSSLQQLDALATECYRCSHLACGSCQAAANLPINILCSHGTRDIIAFEVRQLIC